jgi:hypothetical protein
MADELAQYAAQDLAKYAKKAPPQATIGPDTRGILQRANDWYLRKPTYEGTLGSPGRSPRDIAGDVGKVAAGASLPLIGGGLAMAPAATLLGLGGGAAGGYAGSKGGEYLGEKVGAPELGSDIGGLTGSVFGGMAGARGARPLGNKAAELLRNPATSAQSQLGRPGTVKDILPPQLQRWTVPPWMVPKGELGTPTNPGPFSKVSNTLPPNLRGDPFNPSAAPTGSDRPPFMPLIYESEFEPGQLEQRLANLRRQASAAGTFHAAQGAAGKATNLQQRIGKKYFPVE